MDEFTLHQLDRLLKSIGSFPNRSKAIQDAVRRKVGETPPDVAGMQAKLEAMTTINARLKNECADLRRRLDAESEECRRAQAQLMGLLTDGREKKRGFWSRWFGPV